MDNTMIVFTKTENNNKIILEMDIRKQAQDLAKSAWLGCVMLDEILKDEPSKESFRRYITESMGKEVDALLGSSAKIYNTQGEVTENINIFDIWTNKYLFLLNFLKENIAISIDGPIVTITLPSDYKECLLALSWLIQPEFPYIHDGKTEYLYLHPLLFVNNIPYNLREPGSLFKRSGQGFRFTPKDDHTFQKILWWRYKGDYVWEINTDLNGLSIGTSAFIQPISEIMEGNLCNLDNPHIPGGNSNRYNRPVSGDVFMTALLSLNNLVSIVYGKRYKMTFYTEDYTDVIRLRKRMVTEIKDYLHTIRDSKHEVLENIITWYCMESIKDNRNLPKFRLDIFKIENSNKSLVYTTSSSELAAYIKIFPIFSKAFEIFNENAKIRFTIKGAIKGHLAFKIMDNLCRRKRPFEEISRILYPKKKGETKKNQIKKKLNDLSHDLWLFIKSFIPEEHEMKEVNLLMNELDLIKFLSKSFYKYKMRFAGQGIKKINTEWEKIYLRLRNARRSEDLFAVFQRVFAFDEIYVDKDYVYTIYRIIKEDFTYARELLIMGVILAKGKSEKKEEGGK